MANAKKIISDWSETAKTVYCIIRREADSYLLNSVDGTFGAAPANPYLTLTENATIKGRYEASEARTVWTDGRYTIAVYKQAGASPAPVSDTVIGTGEMDIISDAEIYPDVLPSSRLAFTAYTAPDNAGIAANGTAIGNRPTLAQIEGSTVLAKEAKIDFIQKWILNKLVENPAGTWKLYDDDSVTVLKTWTWDASARMRSGGV